MGRSQANPSGYLFMTLETRSEDGREQLVMVEPPQRRKPTIPPSRTQNTFPRDIMKNTARAKRAAQRRSGGPSSRAQLDSSGHDGHALDHQINIESVMRAVPTSESSAIPITVEAASDTHQQLRETAQPAHVSTGCQMSFVRPSVAGTVAFGGWAASSPFWMSSSDGLESENPTSNGQQSPPIENYSFRTMGNSLDSNLFPHHHPDYSQDVIDSQRLLEVAGAPPSWPATNSENHTASSAHQFPGSTQLTVTSPNSACSHAYEIFVRCALCGSVSPWDAWLGVSGSAPHEQAAHHHSHPLENVGLGLAGGALQAAHFQAPSPTNDLPPWTQSQNTMFSFSRASTSEHSVESRRLTVDAASWQGRPPPDTVPMRLSIPDYAHHRDYPSAAVSASTSPGGSSDFFPTPASATFHDFASPQINILDFDPLILT